jgi:ribose-phosphate pyrophosphokinase
MDYVLFGGTANPDLTTAVARELGREVGASEVERFPDGEVSVHLAEPVRGKEVFVLQPTSPPTDSNLMELLCFADAARRAAAARVNAVIPYFGYARSDKRRARREPITARMIGDVLEAVGIDHVVTVDLHAPQIEGFFRVPVDTLTAVPTMAAALRGRLPAPAVVVAPDAGRVEMASRYSKRLDLPLVVLHKRRETGRETAVTRTVGHVEGRACLIVDDIISTGGTPVRSIGALLQAGARADIWIAATHGLFLEGAMDRLAIEGVSRILVTNSVRDADLPPDLVEVVSLAPVVAGAIRQFTADGYLQELY